MRPLRRAAAVLAAAAIAVAGGLLVAPNSASAHGATVFPGSRQYFCWVDGLQDNGQILPSNPACSDAISQAGPTHLYNWFGNLNPSAAGGTVGTIPDGRICDGGGNGPYDFQAYNAARTDWPVTHLTAGATYQFRHNNWAEHPGNFDIYVTKQGWNPSTPLAWSDLELVDTVWDPPTNGGPGGLNYYFWDTTLPANRSGQHIIFVHWVRSDSPENFYSCSDVVFDGGNGEVTGIGGTPSQPPTSQPPTNPGEPPTVPGPPVVSTVSATSASLSWGASSGGVTAYELVNTQDGANQVLSRITGTPPPTSTALTNLTPDTAYRIAVRAVNDNTGVASDLSEAAPFSTPADDNGGGGPTSPPPASGDCTVTYNITNEWTGGFQGDVTVTNDSSAGIGSWQLAWTFPNGQEITQLWSGRVLSTNGSSVTVGGESWNNSIPANGSVNFGFLGDWNGGNDEPTSFTLNGAACTVA